MTITERILLVSTLYPPNVVGGAEVVVRNLAEELTRQGHEVCVATLAPRGDAKGRVAAGVEIREFEMRFRYWPFAGKKATAPQRLLWHVADNFDPSFYLQLRALIRDFAPTVVNTHNINGFTPAVWMGARHAGSAPIIHTCHDYGLLCSRTTMFSHGHPCRTACVPCRVLTGGKRYLTRLVDGVVGVSEAVLASHLERRLFAHNCVARVIHNGRAPNEPAPSRARTTDGPLRLGFMGRLSEEKGIGLLFKELAGFGDTIVLQVAGRGDTDLVDHLAVSHGVRTTRLGFVTPGVFYQNVDVLVVPSLWQEPLGVVVLEAYGQGVPVVVSNRGGLPELVRHGKNGFIFDPDRAGDLAATVRGLRDDRELLGKLGAHALASGARFTIERMVANYLAFYHEVRSRKQSLLAAPLAT